MMGAIINSIKLPNDSSLWYFWRGYINSCLTALPLFLNKCNQIQRRENGFGFTGFKTLVFISWLNQFIVFPIIVTMT